MTGNKKQEACEALMDGRTEGIEEEALFEQVVACFGRDLEQFARFRCDGRPESEDVYQEALLAALRYLKDFRGDASMKTWLFKLAASACTKMRRGNKNKPELHEEFTAESHQGDLGQSIDPETRVLVWNKFDKLAEALSTLTQEDREILVMHEGEDRPLREICELKGLSLSSVKSRLFRSRKKLRQEMRKRGFDY